MWFLSEHEEEWGESSGSIDAGIHCERDPVQPFGSLFRREVLNKDLLLKKVLIRSLFGPKGPYFQLSNPNNDFYLLFLTSLEKVFLNHPSGRLRNNSSLLRHVIVSYFS